MSISRKQALARCFGENSAHRRTAPDNKISNYYGENVFNLSRMREYLTDEACDGIVDAMENHTPISRAIADQVASAMKEWGNFTRCYALYALVSAVDRSYSRKARQLYHAGSQWTSHRKV